MSIWFIFFSQRRYFDIFNFLKNPRERKRVTDRERRERERERERERGGEWLNEKISQNFNLVVSYNYFLLTKTTFQRIVVFLTKYKESESLNSRSTNICE